jgi:DNA excision repair protein ERCC-2
LLKIYYSAKSHVLAVFPSYEYMNAITSKLKIPTYVESEESPVESLAKLNERTLICAVSRGKLWLLDRRFEEIWWRKSLNCLNPRRVRL